MGKRDQVIRNMVYKFDGIVVGGSLDYIRAEFTSSSEARGFIVECQQYSFVVQAQMDSLAKDGYFVMVYLEMMGYG
jgi:hypothetical protein